MLDDRMNTPSSMLDGLPLWSRESNAFGWRAYLGDRYGTDHVPPDAAPARAAELAGLPPTFITVGTADCLRDEAIDFAARLCRPVSRPSFMFTPALCTASICSPTVRSSGAPRVTAPTGWPASSADTTRVTAVDDSAAGQAGFRRSSCGVLRWNRHRSSSRPRCDSARPGCRRPEPQDRSSRAAPTAPAMSIAAAEART